MLNKTTGIAGLSTCKPQLVLPRSQWAYPALEFNQCTPHCCGNMEKHHPFSPHHQQPAKDHEQDEQEMDDHQQVR